MNSLLRGVCIGAGIMFFADPRNGKKRLGFLRDKFFGANRKLYRGIASGGDAVKNQVCNTFAGVKSALAGHGPGEAARAAE